MLDYVQTRKNIAPRPNSWFSPSLPLPATDIDGCTGDEMSASITLSESEGLELQSMGGAHNFFLFVHHSVGCT